MVEHPKAYRRGAFARHEEHCSVDGDLVECSFVARAKQGRTKLTSRFQSVHELSACTVCLALQRNHSLEIDGRHKYFAAEKTTIND